MDTSRFLILTRVFGESDLGKHYGIKNTIPKTGKEVLLVLNTLKPHKHISIKVFQGPSFDYLLPKRSFKENKSYKNGYLLCLESDTVEILGEFEGSWIKNDVIDKALKVYNKFG